MMSTARREARERLRTDLRASLTITPLRGNHAEYRGDGGDRCPGCGRSHFYVGRLSAECAFCTVALPLADARHVGSAATIWTRGRGRRP